MTAARHLRALVPVVIGAAVIVVPGSQVFAGSGTSRLVPSDTTIRPGDVVTMEVRTATPLPLSGGMNSYFERKRASGGWQRLYMLAWYGRDQPTVRDYNGPVDDLRVQASPFQVVIPPVKPGKYRVVRSFSMNRGDGYEELVLAGRLTVRACPRGEVPKFGPAAEGTMGARSLGTPGCFAK